MPCTRGGLRAALRRALAVVALSSAGAAAAAGCTTTSSDAPTAGSPTSATSSLPGGGTPEAEATYECGPTDAPQITVVGSDLGPDPVVVQVVFDGTVSDRSTALDGPTVTATFQDLHLPRAAYDAGRAEARIVAADDPEHVVAADDVELVLSGGCG